MSLWTTVWIPCASYTLQIRIEAVDEIDSLTLAILRCAQLGQSTATLARALALSDEIVEEQCVCLERQGLIERKKKSKNTIFLSEVGQQKVALHHEVDCFNRSGHLVLSDLATHSLVRDAREHAGEGLRLPPLSTHKRARLSLQDEPELLFELAQSYGLKVDLVSEKEEDYVGTRWPTLRLKREDAGYVKAKLDLEAVLAYLYRRTRNVKDGPCIVFGVSSSCVIARGTETSVVAIVPHFGNKWLCLEESEIPVGTEVNIQLPDEKSEAKHLDNRLSEAITEACKRAKIDRSNLPQSTYLMVFPFYMPVSEIKKSLKLEDTINER